MTKNQLTKEGFEKITTELNEMKTVKKQAAVERLEKARLMGDLSENSEYVAAREDLEFLENRIEELEQHINDAEVIENQSSVNGIVNVGTKVQVKIDGQTEEYIIVGEFEADPMNKKISNTSPIGKALMGKKVGQTAEIDVPAGKRKYIILDIQKV